jgi:phospho-N-acetylmuramoyl-pentapeptide-transferase
MDGLAGGLLAIAFGILGYLAIKDTGRILFMHPRYLMIAIWCAALAGACAGFLWFNGFPASVFMGDIGSLGLGAALGTLSLMINAGLILVILGGVFVAEAVSVMLQVASYKFRNKKRIFRVAPVHHHFQVGGVSEHKLVVRFWLAGIVLGVLAISAF